MAKILDIKFNEDEKHHMFVRLKELIDYIFYGKNNDEYVKNIIFKNDYFTFLDIFNVKR